MKIKKKILLIISVLLILIFGIKIFINYYEQKSEQKITNIQPNEYRINLRNANEININQLNSAIKSNFPGNYYIFIGRPTCPYCRKFSPVIKKLTKKNTVYYFNTDNHKTNKQLKNIVQNKLQIKTVPYITYVQNGKIKKGISNSSASFHEVLNLKKN